MFKSWCYLFSMASPTTRFFKGSFSNGNMAQEYLSLFLVDHGEFVRHLRISTTSFIIFRHVRQLRQTSSTDCNYSESWWYFHIFAITSSQRTCQRICKLCWDGGHGSRSEYRIWNSITKDTAYVHRPRYNLAHHVQYQCVMDNPEKINPILRPKGQRFPRKIHSRNGEYFH